MTFENKLALALLVSMVAVACGGVSRRPEAAPAAIESPWTEVRTAHFVVKTDLDRDSAVAVATEFEAMFSTLSDLAFASGQLPRVTITVVYFRRLQDYEPFAPPRAGAFFRGDTGYDFEPLSLVVMQGDLVSRTRATIQHELTHFFVDHFYPQAPPWLHEGMAVYYETLALEYSRAVVGRLSERGRFYRGTWQLQCAPEGCTALVPMHAATPVKDLVAMDGDVFYGDGQTPPDPEADGETLRAVYARYVSAGSLVRLLFLNPTYRPAFDDFLARLRKGVPAPEAWARTVGQLPNAKLEADFRESLDPREVTVLRTPYEPPRRPPESVRGLSDTEVHLFRAQLTNWATAEGRTAAGVELARIPVSQWQELEVVLLRAAWLHASGKTEDAKTLLEEALRVQPNQPRLLSSLGHIVLDEARAKGAPATTVAAALRPIETRLIPLTRSAAHDRLIAVSVASRGELNVALALARRALRRDPNCISCLVLVAQLLDERGQTADALATATLAQGLLREGRRSPELSQLIRALKLKVDSAGDAKPSR